MAMKARDQNFKYRDLGECGRDKQSNQIKPNIITGTCGQMAFHCNFICALSFIMKIATESKKKYKLRGIKRKKKHLFLFPLIFLSSPLIKSV